jgi:hypothetical protein
VDVVAFAATEGVADAAVDAMIVSDIVADAGSTTTTPAQAPAPQRKRGPGEPEGQVEQLA